MEPTSLKPVSHNESIDVASALFALSACTDSPFIFIFRTFMNSYVNNEMFFRNFCALPPKTGTLLEALLHRRKEKHYMEYHGDLNRHSIRNHGTKLIRNWYDLGRSQPFVVPTLTNLVRKGIPKGSNIDLHDPIHPPAVLRAAGGPLSGIVICSKLVEFRTTIVKLRTNFVPISANITTEKVPIIFRMKLMVSVQRKPSGNVWET